MDKITHELLEQFLEGDLSPERSQAIAEEVSRRIDLQIICGEIARSLEPTPETVNRIHAELTRIQQSI